MLVKLDNKLTRIEEYIGAAILFGIILLGFAQVIMRYVFKVSPAFVEEALLFAFVWLIYLSSSAVSGRGKHITLDIFVKLLPAGVQKVIQFITNIIWFVFAIVMVYTSMPSVTLALTRHTLTTGGKIPYFIGMVAVPVCMVLMAFHVAVRTIVLVTGAVSETKTEEVGK